MRFCTRFCVLPLAALIFAPLPAAAELVVSIDKTTQRMSITRDGVHLHDFAVSTGRPGRDTPSGSFKPFRMEKDHFSREWDDAPMPNSIFFTRTGHAIHGSFEVRKLGSAASAGCVRLAPENAEKLWTLVKQEGLNNVKVAVHGQVPPLASPDLVARRNPRSLEDVPEGYARQDPPGVQTDPATGQRYYRDQYGMVRAYPERQPYGQPQYGQQPYGQPQYEQPQYGQRYYRDEYGGLRLLPPQQPQYGQQYAQPYQQRPYAQQQYGQQQYGQPEFYGRRPYQQQYESDNERPPYYYDPRTGRRYHDRYGRYPID